jgi:DNA polymerase eta
LDTPLPPPQELGITVNWASVGNLIPVTGQKREDPLARRPSYTGVDSETLEAATHARNSLEAEPPLSWTDVALFIGAEIVLAARTAVHQRLGYTASAGTAPNKVSRESALTQGRNGSTQLVSDRFTPQMLAKLCSAWKKPNSQTVLRPCAIPAFLSSMPIQKLRNLGGKLGGQIADTYDVKTVGELMWVSSCMEHSKTLADAALKTARFTGE